MDLIIDIGNTRAKVFAFEGDRIVEGMTTGHTLAGVEEFSKRTGCQRGIYSTTAHIPNEGKRVLASLGFEMMQLTGQTPVPVNIMYHTTETLGADRIAGIVGARSLQPEGDLLVVDTGTCITIDILDHANHYLGGNISPGLEMRLKAMNKWTAALPLIGRDGECPELGYDTDTALRSGVVWGMKYEIEGYIRAFQKKYPGLSVFLTGGDVKKLDISPKITNFAGAKIGFSSEKAKQDLAFRSDCTIFADDFLVPRGLNQILNYNK